MQVDPHYISGLVTSLNSLTASEQKLTAQLSSGLRVTSLSDDAVAVGQASLLAAASSKDDFFVQTAATTESVLQVSGTTLSSVVTQLTTALTLAVGGNSGTANASNLVMVSQQLSGVRDQVIALANTVYQGNYIFSGSKGNVQPFTLDTGTSPATVAYKGDDVPASVTTANGQKLQTTLAGSAVFRAPGVPAAPGVPGADVMAALNNLVADFASGTASATASADIGILRTALDNVSQQQEILGSSLARLQSASTYAQTDSVNRTAAVGTLVGADPTRIATLLSAASVQSQALMTVISTLEKQSLFTYIQ